MLSDKAVQYFNLSVESLCQGTPPDFRPELSLVSTTLKWQFRAGFTLSTFVDSCGRRVGGWVGDNGRLVEVPGSDDKTIWVWDISTGQRLGEPLEGYKDWVNSVAYSPDGKYLVSGSDDKTLQIWDASTKKAVGDPLERHNDLIISVRSSPDGRQIVLVSRDMTIQIWDAKTGQPCTEPLKGKMNSMTYSADGRYVGSDIYDYTICIWDTKTGQPIGEAFKRYNYDINSVAYSLDWKYIASGYGDNTVHIWNAHTGQPLGKPLEGHNGRVNSVAYSPDGHYIQVGPSLEGHNDWVSSVAYSPDGQYIVSGSNDRTIHIWDMKTGQPVGNPLEGPNDWISCVTYSPDGRYIVSGSNDGTIHIWDAHTRQPFRKPLKGYQAMVQSMTFLTHSLHYIMSRFPNRTTQYWNNDKGESYEAVKDHNSRVVSAAYSPDGKCIVSASYDKVAIQIWDAKTGQPVGKPFKGSADKTIQAWNTSTGQPIGEPLRRHNGQVSTVTYSSDGRHIVSGSEDETIRIWDIRTIYAPRQTLESTHSKTQDNQTAISDTETRASPEGYQSRDHFLTAASGEHCSPSECFTNRDEDEDGQWLWLSEQTEPSPSSKPLLWLPRPHLHNRNFYSPRTRLIIGKEINLIDFSETYFGDQWTNIYKGEV
ncbi:hypothetical protein M422DRAFT_243933 [Sphaerobolus stellatus SS14]|nr:hypothetical protein M422DRAFT_243933 [Sphaerobolus stellatus SS14]